MKHHLRLDYSRLAEVLHERGIANVDAIRELLQQSREGGMPFCEALVTTNLVPDWDLSRIVCETFNLPFLPIGMVEPNSKVRAELDMKLFRTHQLVPLDRFGQVLTVVMPALVPADVLAMLAASSDLVLLPVVGTVETNRRWILENLATGSAKSPSVEGGWINLFDQADAEVHASLGGIGEEAGAEDPTRAAAPAPPKVELAFAPAPPDAAEDESLDLGILGDFDEGAMPPVASAGDDDDDEVSDDSVGEDGGDLDLPPMPDFGGGRKAG